MTVTTMAKSTSYTPILVTITPFALVDDLIALHIALGTANDEVRVFEVVLIAIFAVYGEASSTLL